MNAAKEKSEYYVNECDCVKEKWFIYRKCVTFLETAFELEQDSAKH